MMNAAFKLADALIDFGLERLAPHVDDVTYNFVVRAANRLLYRGDAPAPSVELIDEVTEPTEDQGATERVLRSWEDAGRRIRLGEIEHIVIVSTSRTGSVYTSQAGDPPRAATVLMVRTVADGMQAYFIRTTTGVDSGPKGPSAVEDAASEGDD